MKKIMVTGGSGFIGHNLAIHLNKIGHEIVVIDSLSINNLKSINKSEIINQNLYKLILNERINLLEKNKIKLHIIDARNLEKYTKVYEEISPDIIIHLAAVSHASKSNKDPHSTFENSLSTLENTLEISRKKKTHVIFFSSSMVYGDFDDGVVNEETVCKPIGIYGNFKYVGELMIKSYNQVFGVPYTIIRPSALYGERCVSRRVGQVFIESLLSQKEIVINGDSNEKLDFTYIDDLMDGVEKCCTNPKAINEIFNLTYGSSRHIIDLISVLKKNFENIKIVKKSKEKFMPSRGTLDISKAKKLIGFDPKYPIEKGYQKYIDWYKNFYKKNYNV